MKSLSSFGEAIGRKYPYGLVSIKEGIYLHRVRNIRKKYKGDNQTRLKIISLKG
tara:strand:+ start:1674 stop:1835 length:162 start_codon:yes stop_codon:yes gene_type:complete